MQPGIARSLPLGLLVLSCTALDPHAFERRGSGTEAPEAAGWVFDAGPASGGSSSMTSPSGGAGEPPGAGRSAGDPEGGAAGETDDGGASGESRGGREPGAVGGAPPGAGRGGRPQAGAVGSAGWSGSRSAGNGGAGAGGKSVAGSGAAPGGRGGGQGGTGGPIEHALYFSEYVEGSSSYKALELTARKDTALSGCRLVTYFNGAVSGSSIVLDGAVSAGHAYVLCSTQLATLLGTACERTTNLTFNGDDAVALECDGATLDVIGQIGVDPGDAWGSGDASTLNHTLRRACSAVSGDPDGSDAFDPASQWTVLPVDTFDGLGHADCTPE